MAGENIYGPVDGDQPTGPVLNQAPQVQPVSGPVPVGEEIDSAIDRPLVDPEKPRRPADEIKTTPPTGDEWLDFFSRIILKVGMELYTDFAFRGIDDSIVTDQDLNRIKVKKDERDVIARPWAQFAAKNKWTRKHGREIVAATDSIESLMTLGIWMRRVNRIAKKYRPKKQQQLRPQARIREESHGDIGQDAGAIRGFSNGQVPEGYGIYNPGGS